MIGNIRIKVCGLTRVEDGRLALQLGADYLGVIRYPKSPRAVSEQQARLLANTFPAGKRVCVDVAPSPEILEANGDLGFDYFQIHCDPTTPTSVLEAWHDIVGKDRLWLAPRIPPQTPFPEHFLVYADSILFDAYAPGMHGGTGKASDWQMFKACMQKYVDNRFILAGGLSPENIRDALNATSARIVDVNSGVEDSPGIKNHDKLRALFSAVAES